MLKALGQSEGALSAQLVSQNNLELLHTWREREGEREKKRGPRVCVMGDRRLSRSFVDPSILSLVISLNNVRTVLHIHAGHKQAAQTLNAFCFFSCITFSLATTEKSRFCRRPGCWHWIKHEFFCVWLETVLHMTLFTLNRLHVTSAHYPTHQRRTEIKIASSGEWRHEWRITYDFLCVSPA